MLKDILAALARLFLRLQSGAAPSQTIVKPLKVAVVVGHNEWEPGAFAGAPLNMSEWQFNRLVAQAMMAAAPSIDAALDISVFYRSSDKGVGYAEEIRRVYAQTDAWGADVTMELHFNAAGQDARYAVTLSSGSPKSMSLARALDDAFEMEWPDKPSHIWDKSKGQVRRGGLSLITGKAPAVLVEPFFGTNPTSLAQIKRLGAGGLARLYLRAFSAYRQGLLAQSSA